MGEQNKSTAYLVVGALVAVVAAMGGFFLWLNNNRPASDQNVNRSSSSSTAVTSDGTVNSSGTQSDLPAERSIDVSLDLANHSFTPNTFSVKPGDLVQLTLKNKEGIHDFKIDAWNVNSGSLSPDTEQIIQFKVPADASGEVEFYCSIGDHRQRGMVGKVRVS